MLNPFKEIYDSNLINVTKKNKPLIEKSNKPWEYVAASSFDDQNKILLKHKKNNTTKFWEFDENWNYLKSSKVFKNFDQIIENEKLFNFDINNDGIIGEKFEKLELNGDVQMLKDQVFFIQKLIQGKCSINHYK